MLRLFPLNTVLFPRMTLPLHVFEPRYRLLITECVRDGEAFGVVLIRAGVEVGGPAEPHEIGTTAHVTSVSPVDGNRLMVQTAGERRFRILRLERDRPYLRAQVEYPADDATPVAESLVERAVSRYREFVRTRELAEGTYAAEPRFPRAPGVLADTIATAAVNVVPADELQPLVAAFDLSERLERALALFGPLMTWAERQAAESLARRLGAVERQN